MNAPFLGLNRHASFGVCLFLALLVWVVFGQARHFDFVNFDDPGYVYKNPAISNGVSVEGLHWIFTQPHQANWHPITSFSHMLDCQIYGLKPAGHHLTNVLFHMANSILLFLILRSMTGSLWRSALVAALFSIHPLRVESVVWVSERKDVLSGFFFMLTIAAYIRYVRRKFSLRRYGLALLFFLLGLMSKPMLVTLPFVLFLLDFWPLQRVGIRGGGGERLSQCFENGVEGVFPIKFSNPTALEDLHVKQFKYIFLEKLPFFLISFFFCIITVWAQKQAIASGETLELSALWRIGNAAVSYVVYIYQTLVPIRLCVFYPHRLGELPVWQIIASFLVLVGLSLGAIRYAFSQHAASQNSRHQPSAPRNDLLIGWLWYLGMLIPVIGLLQVGTQAHADRYTYLPQIGLLVAGCWWLGDWARTRCRQVLSFSFSIVILTGFMAIGWIQSGYWRDSISLWSHVVVNEREDKKVLANLGSAYFEKGDVFLAMSCFKRALQIDPEYELALYLVGFSFISEGALDEGIVYFKKALTLNPDRFDANKSLGAVLIKKGDLEQAIMYTQRAIRQCPDDQGARDNLKVAKALLAAKDAVQSECGLDLKKHN